MRRAFCQTLLKISVILLFLFWRQNVINFILGFHMRQHIGFALRFHFGNLRFCFGFIERIAGNNIMYGATLFQRRTFHLFALRFHNVANLLLLRIRQVQVFKHHIVMRAKLTFMLHHWLHIRWRGGVGLIGMSQIRSPHRQGRGHKQSGQFTHIFILPFGYFYGIFKTVPCSRD
ncbi:hypothetical protein SARI_01670 [Salmonella enterica subsp. arizonae serovar 62:z4,z23:-]|uniref:Uncharacterized protein n=1 Tax=Salmonella arizonae (strain ATCC BAA-731 / CDC346-86 / RSK2980) TaxID=41514 RepID=A9MFF7_SALAR|nr:hypothetical protein SARI_01670 [Salmonella enterica subsp. arizonae serovar 62:z4,z23:-]